VRPPNSLSSEQLWLATEVRRTDVAWIADLLPLPVICNDIFDADAESNDLSDLGGSKAKAPISLKQMEFSLTQFAKQMGWPNCITFNSWKKEWVPRLLKKKHRSTIPAQNSLNYLPDGSLHRVTEVAGFLQTFNTWLPLEDFNNAEWIRQ